MSLKFTENQRSSANADTFDVDEDSLSYEEAFFLSLIDADIQQNPEQLKPIPQDLLECINDLVKGVEVDLDSPLPLDDPIE
ncbi:type II toxin-antitoxin system PrlF family antitoxin [Endozoicomonas lisbonensis]|uniref:Uncharacterized protein n=1 Tax=Endozoicomonas lisbonensis TaxID=3120522 RepID=A0ABV2SD88_9GAMM